MAVLASFAAMAQGGDVDKLMKSGKPAQLYAAAIESEGKGDSEQAGKFYRVLIAKYPDSPYTEKAIAKMEAANKSAADRKLADEQAKLATEQKTQAHAMCVSQCDARRTQCLAAADNAGDDAVLGGLFDVLTGGDGVDAAVSMTGSAIRADNQSAACGTNHTTCVASCS